MSCALHQTSKMLVQGRYMNANHFGNFSLGVGTSRVQFNCLHHLFLGPLLNLFILMSTVGVPFDLVVFLPLYSLVLTSFLAMFNLGSHTIKEKCVSQLSHLANWVWVQGVSLVVSLSFLFNLGSHTIKEKCVSQLSHLANWVWVQGVSLVVSLSFPA